MRSSAIQQLVFQFIKSRENIQRFPKIHIFESGKLTKKYSYSLSSAHLIFRNHAHIGLKNCSLEAELDEAAQGTGLAFIVMADVFTKVEQNYLLIESILRGPQKSP